jgi:hypothetical protein
VLVIADLVIELPEFDRLKRAVVKNNEKIAIAIANQAVRNATSNTYNEGMTPDIEFEAEVEIVGDDVVATLSADPKSRGQEFQLLFALGGRKAYFITVKPPGRRAKNGSGRPGMMVWPAGVKGDPIDGAARRVFKPAIAPAIGGDFMRKAMRNAIQTVANRYR